MMQVSSPHGSHIFSRHLVRVIFRCIFQHQFLLISVFSPMCAGTLLSTISLCEIPHFAHLVWQLFSISHFATIHLKFSCSSCSVLSQLSIASCYYLSVYLHGPAAVSLQPFSFLSGCSTDAHWGSSVPLPHRTERWKPSQARGALSTAPHLQPQQLLPLPKILFSQNSSSQDRCSFLRCQRRSHFNAT